MKQFPKIKTKIQSIKLFDNGPSEYKNYQTLSALKIKIKFRKCMLQNIDTDYEFTPIKKYASMQKEMKIKKFN